MAQKIYQRYRVTLDTNLSRTSRPRPKPTPNRTFIGTGSTADAIRNERLTGTLTYGKDHAANKGPQYLAAIRNWQKRNGGASAYDKIVAESLRRDLEEALGKK